jgi:hypothetical protein
MQRRRDLRCTSGQEISDVCGRRAYIVTFTKSHDLNMRQLTAIQNPYFTFFSSDRLCGLVVRVSGYRSRGPKFDSRLYQVFCEVVGLERGPLSLVNITEELLEWNSSGSGFRKSRLTAKGIRCADHDTPTIRKSWH